MRESERRELALPSHGPSVEDREWRARDILALGRGAVEELSSDRYRVRSQRVEGYYTVERTPKGWSCSCPDFKDRARPCKHVYAVVLKDRPDEAFVRIVPEPAEPNLRQDWPAFDRAQQAEFLYFEPIAWGLIEDVPEPQPPRCKPGRKPIPYRTELLHAATKVHLGISARRARGQMLRVVGSGNSLLPTVPNYAQPSRVFNREGTTSTWLDLLRRSAQPLRGIERDSTVAIDSSGFCVTCKASYCAETHDNSPRHQFVKCHAIVGVKSHIVIDARITDEHGGDSPQFVPLLRGAIDSGFRPNRVTADKAYLARDSCNFAAEHGIEPVIPFRSNNTGRSQGSVAFRRMYLLFELHRDEFERRYHARSNVESVFSAIKSKMGERLFSKNPVARVNELLAKLLSYNISVLIHELYEHQIDLQQIGFTAPATGGLRIGGAS